MEEKLVAVTPTTMKQPLPWLGLVFFFFGTARALLNINETSKRSTRPTNRKYI